MEYDTLYKNNAYVKYLENKISNEKIIERYNLDDTNISLLNEYVSLKLKIAYFNLLNLQREIDKLKNESEFSDYNRYFFTNFLNFRT